MVKDCADRPKQESAADNGAFTLTKSGAINFMTTLATEAHAHGMAIGLKNAADIIQTLLPNIEFAVNEQCASKDNKECQRWKQVTAAGKPVFHIEYPHDEPVVVTDTTQWCSKAPADDNGKTTDITDFSTAIKDMDLTGWVETCDGKVYETATA